MSLLLKDRMFIKEIKIKNFKCFGDEETSLEFKVPDGASNGSGLNILIGENNTGKSTIFEAVSFLRNNIAEESIETVTNKNSSSKEKGFRVELCFSGDIDSIVGIFARADKKDLFAKHIYSKKNTRYLKFSRESNEHKKLILWDPTKSEYSHFGWIEAELKRLFELNFISPDSNPNDELSNKSSTLTGSLLKIVLKNISDIGSDEELSKAFDETFNNDSSDVRKELEKVERSAQEKLKEQYHDTKLKFQFDELKIDSFLKNIRIEVDDGVQTNLEQKGSGMKRAIVLALLQVYADMLSTHPDNSNIAKSFLLFIDEPEVCLHPLAQKSLLNSLMKISRTNQVFIATHSPYFFTHKDIKNSGLFIFKKDKKTHTVKVDPLDKKGKWKSLFPWGPSFSEISYRAYNLPTSEFHNELYGYLHSKIIDLVRKKEGNKEDKDIKRISTFDTYLQEEIGVSKFKKYKWPDSKKEEITLCTYIRHKMHHPENRDNTEYSERELKESIDVLVKAIKALDKIDK